MRYFISILVFGIVAAFWTEFVTKKAGQGLGLFGILGIAFVGVAIASAFAALIRGNNASEPVEKRRTFSSQQDDRMGSHEPKAATVAPSEHDGRKKETRPEFEHSVKASPLETSSSSNNADWFVIHAGEEHGPFSLGELVERAIIGKIEADDLVKQTGGLWIKARNIDPLREQFLLQLSNKDPIDDQQIRKPGAAQQDRVSFFLRLGRLYGIWTSRKALLISLLIFVLLLAGGTTYWLVRRADLAEQRRLEAIWRIEDEMRRQFDETERRIERERFNDEMERLRAEERRRRDIMLWGR